jgi:hypothetical protein
MRFVVDFQVAAWVFPRGYQIRKNRILRPIRRKKTMARLKEPALLPVHTFGFLCLHMGLGKVQVALWISIV